MCVMGLLPVGALLSMAPWVRARMPLAVDADQDNHVQNISSEDHAGGSGAPAHSFAAEAFTALGTLCSWCSYAGFAAGFRGRES